MVKKKIKGSFGWILLERECTHLFFRYLLSTYYTDLKAMSTYVVEACMISMYEKEIPFGQGERRNTSSRVLDF